MLVGLATCDGVPCSELIVLSSRLIASRSRRRETETQHRGCSRDVRAEARATTNATISLSSMDESVLLNYI